MQVPLFLCAMRQRIMHLGPLGLYRGWRAAIFVAHVQANCITRTNMRKTIGKP